ncbi:hypothetical protein [Klebsiella phage phiKp_21]|nr:hypothetical protein [Klebsiella phage phiKp_21]
MEKTSIIENGDINDILSLNGFKIHDIMFSVRDIIQCLFLCSKTMYDYYHSDLCNMFVITISTENSFILSFPMNTNEEFIQAVLRNDNVTNAQTEVHRKKNTYTIKDDKIIMFVSKGFIMDNFIVKESYHDFKIEPDSSKVMIYASDIESITVSDPELE